MPPAPEYAVRDPRQLAALASPVRQEVVDTVIALGSASIREVAEALGRPADGLYYHVRKLVEVGLLVAADGEGGNGEVRYRPPTAGIMRLVYDPSEPGNVAAVSRIVTSMARMAERDFEAGFGPDLARVDGPERNLNASRQRAWLGADERREVNRLLGRLQEIFSSARRPDDGELHTLTFVLAPVEAQPTRRG